MFADKKIVQTNLLTQFITRFIEVFHDAACHLLMAVFSLNCPPRTQSKSKNFAVNGEPLMSHTEADLLFELRKDKLTAAVVRSAHDWPISAVNNQ